MGKIVTGASVSLDGYIAGPEETGFEHLFTCGGANWVGMVLLVDLGGNRRGCCDDSRPDRRLACAGRCVACG
jgi:hypothetical protein